MPNGVAPVVVTHEPLKVDGLFAYSLHPGRHHRDISDHHDWIGRAFAIY